jgi:hypothetical protein
MNYGKALEETWEARKRLAKKLEGMSDEEQVRYIHENAMKTCKKYGILYKVKDRQKIAA